MPDTAEPVPPDNEVVGEPGDSVTAAPLSDEQFDARATSYLELLEVRVGDALAKGARIELEHGVSISECLLKSSPCVLMLLLVLVSPP